MKPRKSKNNKTTDQFLNVTETNQILTKMTIIFYMTETKTKSLKFEQKQVTNFETLTTETK